MMLKKRYFLFLLPFFLINFMSVSGGTLKSIEVMGGYFSTSIREREDYQVIPLFISFGFSLKSLEEKIGFNPKGILEFQIEPFLNPVLSPENNLELGVSFFFKYIFPLNKKVAPYIKMGAGPSYLTQHLREQGTQINFVEQVGAGISVFLKDNFSFNWEYRYRHLSNAGIKYPNKGVEAYLSLFGFSYFFD